MNIEQYKAWAKEIAKIVPTGQQVAPRHLVTISEKDWDLIQEFARLYRQDEAREARAKQLFEAFVLPAENWNPDKFEGSTKTLWIQLYDKLANGDLDWLTVEDVE